MKRRLFFFVLVLIFLYVVMYMCVYVAVFNFILLKKVGFAPEIRCTKMLDDPHGLWHSYVHVCGYDLFLSPFVNYSDEYRSYATVADYINGIGNWGKLYNPFNNTFVNVF